MSMSSDFYRTNLGGSIVLAPTPRLCPSYQCSYSVVSGFSLLADEESDEEARSGWVPESNRH